MVSLCEVDVFICGKKLSDVLAINKRYLWHLRVPESSFLPSTFHSSRTTCSSLNKPLCSFCLSHPAQLANPHLSFQPQIKGHHLCEDPPGRGLLCV